MAPPRTPQQRGQPPVFTTRRRDTRRRRLLATGVVAGGVGGALWLVASPGGGSAATPPTARAAQGHVTLTAGNAVLARIATSRYIRAGHPRPDVIADAVDAALPETSTAVTGRIKVTYAYDPAATARLVARLGAAGGTIRVVRRPTSTTIQAPARRQQQANTCESAALSILLSTIGRTVGEAEIQRSIPRSGPIDPAGEGPARVWGDPDRGYVGRPDGGGTAGGFGVYPAPLVATAARFGVRLQDLTGRPASAVYGSLLSGHAVMAWVGLSSGPVGSWTSPRGKPITVNFGEHTVVLHGIREDGSVLVSNPLKGTRSTWTRATFERMWNLLDQRAVSTAVPSAEGATP